MSPEEQEQELQRMKDEVTEIDQQVQAAQKQYDEDKASAQGMYVCMYV